MSMSKLQTLLIDQLQMAVSAESQAAAALPDMVSAAHNPKLKEVLQKHLTETEQHVQRAQQALTLLGGKAGSQTCLATKGIVAEAAETIAKGKKMPSDIADLALAGAAQKLEHFEIASYGTLRNIARLIGELQVANLLDETLNEEETADFLLTEVSKPILQEAATELFTEKGLKKQAVTTSH